MRAVAKKENLTRINASNYGSGFSRSKKLTDIISVMALHVRPVLIFDGKCGFCGIWIEYWKQLTGDAIQYAASQDVRSEYPQIPDEEWKHSVQLVLPNGEVFRGAEAVFRTLALANVQKIWLWLYQHVPLFAPVAERVYAWIAAHRDFGYTATTWLFGRRVQPAKYAATAKLFRIGLALIWMAAFASFGVQAIGLIGQNGILPAGQYLQRAQEFLGSGAHWAIPTVLWWNSSDAAIQALWITGLIAAALSLIRRLQRIALSVAFVSYLSLVNASQDFLGFQWDLLLLEAGFLAIFLGDSKVIVWMFRWLLFRLMFLSGAVKLLSGDSTWSGLHALSVHFQTQPIPTPLAWYVHQLPTTALRASTAAVLFLELIVPLFVLGPRRLRFVAAPFLIGLQVLILLTGNYAFFNWLTLALCLFLFDDAAVQRVLPLRLLHNVERRRPVLGWGVAALLFVLSTSLFVQTFTGKVLVRVPSQFGLTSSYGLFATMTTRRGEIVVEGSSDGTTWRAYEFKYKPGPLDRRPPWVAPHQPRLDWQMWFAALGTYQENPWFVNFVYRLLEGRREVLALLEENPFPDAPPRFVRAQLYEYRFTDRGQNEWWTRTPVGAYLPPVSLESFVQR